jgi:hypothetical protein
MRPPPSFSVNTSHRELAFDRGGLRFLVILDGRQAALTARLAAALAPRPAPSTGDTQLPDLRYVVEPWQAAWGPATGAGYRVSRDGVVRYLGRCVDCLVRWILRDIDELAGHHPGDGLLLRGAAVVWRERAILLPGRSGTGTSSLAADLVRCGATRYADGLVFLDHAGRVHPAGDTRGPSAPRVLLVVATTYRPGLSWRPGLSRGGRAVLPIVERALAQGVRPRRALRLAAGLAAGLATLRGAYGEAADAAPQILATLDGLLDGSPMDGERWETTSVLDRATGVLATGSGDTRARGRAGAIRW